MKLFTCEHCGQTLYFDNFHCIRCQHELGFLPDRMVLSALHLSGKEWRPVDAQANSIAYRKCANYSEHNLCNWMIPSSPRAEFVGTRCREVGR
jgi:hypothetical protein